MTVERTEREVMTLLRLSIPIVIAQVGQMMLGVIDAAYAGHLSVHALDAVTLGSLWQLGSMMPLSGIIWGLGPLVSQAHGAGRGDEVGLAVQRAIVLACSLALLVAIAWTYTAEALALLGQDPALIETAAEFVRTQRFAAPGFVLYAALSTYLNSRGIVRPATVTMLVANVFNALLGWALTFGELGLPALGVRGLAISTGLTDLLLPIVLGLLIWRAKLYEGAWVPWSRRTFSLSSFVLLLRLGIPNGVTLALEMWSFQLGTVIAGRLGTHELGAHAIALSLASLSFMVPLGVGIGTSARIGQLIGAGSREAAQRSAHTALRLCAGYGLFAVATFVLARRLLPRLYSQDEAIVSAAAAVLPIAGAFQLFDAVQACGSGVMRGMGKPRITATFNLIGYFAIGIPLAYYLGLRTELGLRGIWLGYAAGLAFVATCLVGTVLSRGPRTVKPLVESRL